MSFDLVVVTPADYIEKFIAAGFRPGRSNNYTTTLIKTYPSDEEAMRVGHRLNKFVWSVEKKG